ncbi:CsbD family protein [Amycolatopsis sp. K13G38]|uniref:CsbD family protein n=1 Tax=Amycolatopsis acididurans TaxID=2724524 RepID=A0ABX1J8F3_9PSEU|nr:CsbD family protein [Amycolatopsis acididurans]NKQ56038.1 CsbD family protein [Amycolatopsis acididurans]
MSLGDKVQGKAKQAAGELSGDEKLRAEGKTDQAKAAVEDAVESVKDAAGDVAGKIRDVFDRK